MVFVVTVCISLNEDVLSFVGMKCNGFIEFLHKFALTDEYTIAKFGADKTYFKCGSDRRQLQYSLFLLGVVSSFLLLQNWEIRV